MPLSIQGYFNGLRSYLNADYFIPVIGNEIILKEKIHVPGSSKKKEISVALQFRGDVFAIKLDGKNDPLFHFLDDNGKPWSKRCDFVIFQLYRKRIFVYCIEFKHGSLDAESIIAQLTASQAWCQSLLHTVGNYQNERKKLWLKKYVFSNHANPAAYLDAQGKYLTRDHSIRHYQYADVDRMQLEDLENVNIEELR